MREIDVKVNTEEEEKARIETEISQIEAEME